MERIFQWTWDRFGPRYSWAVCGVLFGVSLPIFLLDTWVVLAFQGSSRYGEAIAFTLVAVLIRAYLMVLPGSTAWRPAERWAAGEVVDRMDALNATYVFARRAAVRTVLTDAVWSAAFLTGVAAIAGAAGADLIAFGIWGVAVGVAAMLISLRGFAEGVYRPARVAIAGDTEIGDAMPRAHPTFANWTTLAMVMTAFAFALSGAMLAAILDVARHGPALAVAIAGTLTVVIALPISVVASFTPAMRPIRDLARGT